MPVILSLEQYKRMDHALQNYRVSALQSQRLTESIEDMEAGRTKPASEVFSALKGRYEQMTY